MGKSSFLIRTLCSSDAEEYIKLRLHALQESPEAFGITYEETINKEHLLESYQERLRPTDYVFSMGIFDGEKLVSIATLLRENSVKAEHKSDLLAVYSDPLYRKKGLSKMLIASLIEKAKEIDGLEQIHLAVVNTNQAACNLYRSLGFIPYGTEKHAMKWNGRYWDEVHMVLFL
jgi:RimJ/RimL family protein N-acetyltransferase